MADRNKSYSIIAGAALQFIDYDFDLSLEVGDKPGKPLGKRRKPFHVAQDKTANKNILLPLEELADQPGEYMSPQRREIMPLHYEVEYQQAFECCQGQWLPLPFLLETGHWPDGSPRYAYGPTDWARGYLSRLGGEGSPRFRLTLVFDPRVEDGASDLVIVDGRRIQHTLTQADVAGNTSFNLAVQARDNAWFIDGLPWVKEALRNCRDSFKEKNPRRALSRLADDFPLYGYEGGEEGAGVVTEYMAVYAAMLDALGLIGSLRPVRVVNPARITPVKVDLVLDIGNSRLTGVLVETVPQGATKLTDCYPLPVRDLSEPANIYAEPLEAKIEFSEPYFGPEEWSLASRQHGDSFLWPSAVRLGPEARRMAAGAREEKGPTGMSSPKRYLWDTRQRLMEWHLNNVRKLHGESEETAVNYGAFLTSVNVAGVPLTAARPPAPRADGVARPRIPIPAPIKNSYPADGDMAAFEARYSRSSLMMFLLSEIIAQALSSVNSPVVRDSRNHPDAPRRLASIILTVPTAMPLAEQNIFKTWARLAVETVWSALGWSDYYRPESLKAEAGDQGDFRDSPAVRCDWDEATCTQIVWLYNELHEKFHNNARELFDLLGRRRGAPGRPGGPAEAEAGAKAPSLRIASIDMGGGTTDLSITTYALNDPVAPLSLITPRQDFRDGFNVAGDDIMRQIILNQFIAKIARAAAEAGVPDAESLVGDLFKDTPQMGAAPGGNAGKILRGQFVAQTAVPVALHILKRYEEADLSGDDLEFSVRVGDVPGLAGREADGRLAEVLGYMEKPLRAAGWADFSLLDLTLAVDLREVDRDADSIVEKMMADMGEVVKLYDCDVLILTGRPSRWPAMMRAPYARLFLPVDRVVHMHQYRVGAGYPFVAHGRIEDPKTTVVVGAIICALAEGSLEGIAIDTANFVPQPTTRYLGELDAHGRLERELVWFADIDVNSDKEFKETCGITFKGPTAVGFRQLSCPRWTTTRLYSLEFKTAEAQEEAKGRLPYAVSIEYSLKEAGEPDEAPRPPGRLRRAEGVLKVLSVVDKNGKGNALPPGKLTARLQTLRRDDGYWLDTGALYNL